MDISIPLISWIEGCIWCILAVCARSGALRSIQFVQSPATSWDTCLQTEKKLKNQSSPPLDVVNLVIQLTFSWTKPIRRRTNHNPKHPWPTSGNTILIKKTTDYVQQLSNEPNEDFDILRASYNPSLLAFLLASSRRAECARCAVWIFTAEASWASCTWSRRAWR